MKMYVRFLLNFLIAFLLSGSLFAQSVKKPILTTDPADTGEGSIYLTGEVSGSGILQIQLYKGSSEANAVLIESAANTKTVKTGALSIAPPVTGNPSIRIGHSSLLKAKMNGLLVPGSDESVSILGKITLGGKVSWTAPFKYKFAARDRVLNAANKPRFKPIRCDTAAATELYEVDGEARYLLVADVNLGATVNIHTGPVDNANTNLLGLKSFGWFEDRMDGSKMVAFFNASMFTEVPKDPTKTILGLKNNNVWREPNNKEQKRRAMRLDTDESRWNVEYRSFEADSDNYSLMQDFNWFSDKTKGKNILVGYIPHDKTTLPLYRVADAQTFVGASAKGISFYVFSCDSGSYDKQSPQQCKNTMIAAGIPENSLIWLDGGTSAFLQTKLNGVSEQWVDFDIIFGSRDIPVMLSVYRR